MIDFKSLRVIVCVLSVLLIMSCEDVVFLEDISEDTITVLAPADGAQVINSNVNFNWEGIEGASGYKLQVAEPNFEQANQIVVDTIASTISFFSILPSGDYEWRIKGINDSYQTEYSIQSFKVIED